MQIQEITYMQYELLLPNECKCALSNYYVSLASSGGKIYALIQDTNIISYAIILFENTCTTIKYIFTKESERNLGHATYLIKGILNIEKQYPFIRIHITENLSSYKTISDICGTIGFISSEKNHVFSFDLSPALWNKMDSLKLTRMKDIWLRSDFVCTSFANMSEAIKNQLVESANTSFKNSLNPKDLIQNNANIANDLSFVLTKDETLYAYSLVTALSFDTICIEQISETNTSIGSGIIIAPLCSTLEIVRKNQNIKRMNLAIYDSNDKSLGFVLGMLDDMKSSEIVNKNYIYFVSR